MNPHTALCCRVVLEKMARLHLIRVGCIQICHLQQVQVIKLEFLCILCITVLHLQHSFCSRQWEHKKLILCWVRSETLLLSLFLANVRCICHAVGCSKHQIPVVVNNYLVSFHMQLSFKLWPPAHHVGL